MPRTRRRLQRENAKLRLQNAALLDELARLTGAGAVPGALTAAAGAAPPVGAPVPLDAAGTPVVAIVTPDALASPGAAWQAILASAALPPCSFGVAVCLHRRPYPPGLLAVVKRRRPGEVAVHAGAALPAQARRQAVAAAMREARRAGWCDPPAPAPPRRPSRAAPKAAAAVIAAVLFAVPAARLAAAQVSGPSAAAVHEAHLLHRVRRGRPLSRRAEDGAALQQPPQHPAAPQRRGDRKRENRHGRRDQERPERYRLLGAEFPREHRRQISRPSGGGRGAGCLDHGRYADVAH